MTPQSLRAFLEQVGCAPGQDFDWEVPGTRLAEKLGAHVSTLSEEERAALFAALERVERLGDEIGLRCLLDSAAHREPLLKLFGELPGPLERALHMIVADPALFERAELMRYVEAHRMGRIWNGYLAPAGLAPADDEERKDALKEALREHFLRRDGSGRVVVVDVFERLCSRGKQQHSLLQVMVYLEGPPESTLAFEGDDLKRLTHRPAVEVAWTYSPETGVLEVLAKGGRQQRTTLAKLFLQHLLGCADDVAPIPLRMFELDSLRRPRDFPTDPEDGIASVSIRKLRLRPLDDVGFVTLEGPGQADRTLHELSRSWFGQHDPLRSGFRVVQARLTIEFLPRPGHRRGKLLHIDITVPNGSTLKDRIDAERLISEKYVERWGLLRTV